MTAELAILMRHYCDGDPQAFIALYEQTASKLRHYLVRLTRDDATAEDLLQLSFLKIHKARSSYIDGAKPLPWMYTIAHRTFLDHVRKRKRARIVDVGGELPEESANLIGKRDENHEPMDDTTTLDATMDALQSLPRKQRQAIVLTKLDGRSMREAAEIAGTTIGAMKVRAHRGYTNLKKTLLTAQNTQT